MRLVLLCFVLLMSGCESINRYVEWHEKAPPIFPKLTAIGTALVTSQVGKNDEIRLIHAMKASKIAAYQELAEQIYGLQISSKQSLTNGVLQQQEMYSSVDGLVKGARVIRSYPAGDYYITELELDFGMVWDLRNQNNRPREIKAISYF